MDLPHLFVKENKANIPFYALFTIAGFAAMLAIIGSLGSLVDAASLIFLFTFGTVNYIAFKQNVKWKWFSLVGAIGCGLAILSDIIEQFHKIPIAMGSLVLITASIFIFRPYILRKLK